ncbi:MAG: FAD-dependent oxidoreductase, partial [Proteobacteria bacterium]|nr:FAD-dependent oxidoreductase [Pseudomonadota bacterium]
MSAPYDVLVIGSGPGGYVAAIRAAQLGLRTACVERESLGGICLNWGCIPTKALLRSAEMFDHFQHAKEFGITVGEVTADFPAIIARSRGIADKVSKGVGFLLKKNKIDSIAGVAKLLPRAGAWKPHQVEVTSRDGTTIHEAKHVILATGCRARSLPGIELDGERIIEYRKAMTLPTQP